MIHPTAIVENEKNIGEGTKIWHHAHVRYTAIVGKNCVLGKNVYIDKNVKIGDNVKIQNNVNVYDAVIEDDVFIGPNATFTNDKFPRAKTWDPDEKRKRIVIKKGASIGAGSIILPEITIGENAMIGAGSVVTKDVEANTLVMGVPAKKVRDL